MQTVQEYRNSLLYARILWEFQILFIGQTSDHKNTLANEFSCVIKQPWLLHILWQSLHRTSSLLHSTKKFRCFPCTNFQHLMYYYHPSYQAQIYRPQMHLEPFLNQLSLYIDPPL